MSERYRTLRLYHVAVDDKYQSEAMNLSSDWKQLKEKALTKDKRMVRTKQEFSMVTQQQVLEFVQECREIFSTFRASGPGAPEAREMR